jgi:hypothetical protein
VIRRLNDGVVIHIHDIFLPSGYRPRRHCSDAPGMSSI